MNEIGKIILGVWFIVCLVIIMLSNDYKSARGAIVSCICTLALLARIW